MALINFSDGTVLLPPNGVDPVIFIPRREFGW